MKEKKVEEKRDKLPVCKDCKAYKKLKCKVTGNFDIFIFYLSMSPITISRN